MGKITKTIKQGESDETKAKMFLINKGYPIDTNGRVPTYEEMYNIIKEAIEKENNEKLEERLDKMIEADLSWLKKQDEQKPANKVEPKFNVGDWVVNKLGDSWHIDSFDKKNYQVSDGKGKYNYFPISKQDEMHLWTIKDAKDGDVLTCNEEILLFKSYSVKGRISLYCWYNGQTNNFHSKGAVDTSLTTRNKICPATKEQRELLFAKMKEAGYEWNNEKKELKNIKQKLVDNDEPKFKVGNWI